METLYNTVMLAITMGDPNGIGPEIITKLLNQPGFMDCVVIGNSEALGKINKKVTVIDPFGPLKEHNNGRATAQNGEASYWYVLTAIEMAQKGIIDGIVTAPLNKEALHKAGYRFDGHTEILAGVTGTKKFGMMFWSPKLNIMLSTIHKPLEKVPGLLTKQKFQETIDLALSGMNDLGVKNPRIGVCGLNPHAGEGGLFGDEEQKIMIPVIRRYKNVFGPYSADTLFTPERIRQFDLIIAHYHDQGLIPLKMLAFDTAVNITVGLPIVRTSVDHGTAYDIVGKNSAHTGSLKNAIVCARKIVRSRNGR